MKLTKLSKTKGVAGLNVYLSLIAMLFMIGIILMVFMIAGTKLQESTYDSGTSVVVANETIAKPNSTGITLAGASARDGSCGAITSALNHTTGTYNIVLANFTQTGCVLRNATSNVDWGTSIRVSYSYTYSADNSATKSINDTQSALSGATDFFPTFITLGAMVVLILLVVIIINSIRATGVTNEGA